MWGWHQTLPALFSLLLPLALSAGQDEPIVWLERMAQSLHSHSYEGTFVFQRGDRIDTVKVVHSAENGGYRERLQTMTGSAREVIRSVDRISALKGARVEANGGRGQQATPHRPPAIAGMILRANERYDLKSPGFDRIAGFTCYVLHAAARDDYRYSHQYCLHQDTGLPLSSELIGADGQLLERLVFTELAFLDVVFEESLEPSSGCEARHIEVRAAELSGDVGESHSEWYFEGLPPGFSPVIVTERVFGPDSPPSLHFVLSDGLATVSVYVDTNKDRADMFEGATRSGATHAFARPLAGHQLTVVGEVPGKTVEWIANAARFRPGNSGETAPAR